MEEVMRLNKLACMGVVWLAATTGSVSMAANNKTAGELAFDQLKTLVGEWEGTNESGPVKATYTLVAGGTALMERLQTAKDAEMITMYSADGARIQVTHYCSYGNQPQMRTETLKGTGNQYSFSLVSITGLKDPGEGHMTGLVLTLVDKDHMTQEWKHISSKGKTGGELVEFKRKPEKAATVVPGGD